MTVGTRPVLVFKKLHVIHGLCGCLLTQSCLTLCKPTDCSPPGSSVHGILQARYWSGLPCPPLGGSSQPRDQNRVFCIADRFFTNWATREALFLGMLGFKACWDQNNSNPETFLLPVGLGHRDLKDHVVHHYPSSLPSPEKETEPHHWITHLVTL